LIEGKCAAYTAILSILDRARRLPHGVKASALRYHLWLELVHLAAIATTMGFLRGVQLGYDHICAAHLYPSTDTFYPGDSDYTYRIIADECRSTYTDRVKNMII
jgi:hypothetical protein